MKLVRYMDKDDKDHLGILRDEHVVAVDNITKNLPMYPDMPAVIDNFASLQSELRRLSETGPRMALSEVRLRAPLPRPSRPW